MNKSRIRRIAGNIIAGLLLYVLLLVAYFFAVLRYLGGWLSHLYRDDLTVYAFVCLGLVVVQAIFLDLVTTFLLNHLRVDQLE